MWRVLVLVVLIAICHLIAYSMYWSSPQYETDIHVDNSSKEKEDSGKIEPRSVSVCFDDKSAPTSCRRQPVARVASTEAEVVELIRSSMRRGDRRDDEMLLDGLGQRLDCHAPIAASAYTKELCPNRSTPGLR